MPDAAAGPSRNGRRQKPPLDGALDESLTAHDNSQFCVSFLFVMTRNLMGASQPAEGVLGNK